MGMCCLQSVRSGDLGGHKITIKMLLETFALLALLDISTITGLGTCLPSTKVLFLVDGQNAHPALRQYSRNIHAGDCLKRLIMSGVVGRTFTPTNHFCT